MANNPIKPVVPPNQSKVEGSLPPTPESIVAPSVNELPTSGNAFTDSMKSDESIFEGEEILNEPADALDKTVEETTGQKLTREQQMEFIKTLPNDLMLLFAKRVKDTIAEEEAAHYKERAKPQYVTDFTTVQEASIFDLNVPIEAIDHQVPEYLNIELLDPNFQGRWIQTSSKRLGQARSQGWQYVVAEDLAKKLGVEIEPDTQGHFVYIDTVAMKMPKNKLFSQLRSNYLRAVASTQQSKLHERMKSVIETEIQSARDPRTGLPMRESFIHYRDKNAMNVYSPLG